MIELSDLTSNQYYDGLYRRSKKRLEILYHMAFHLTAVVGVLSVVVGCRDYTDLDNAADTATSEPDAQSSAKTVRFAGRDWQFVGPTRNAGDVFRPWMAARVYITREQGIRLLELSNKGPSPLKEKESVFSRILRVQRKNSGRWISDGKAADWMLNGHRGEVEYVDGKPHGTQREWYSNGQLHIERQWADGKMNGRDRGWYESGKPQYEATNVDDEEVEGTFWNEDGTEG